jgi:hypothetical protein
LKKPTLTRMLMASSLLSLVLLQACATKVKATATNNPPPAEAFQAFGRIEVKPLVFKDGFKGDAAGLAKIQENLKKDLGPSLEKWNASAPNGRSLVIEPVIEQMEFQHGAKRVFLGPLAGSSGVLLRLNVRDDKGVLIASPEFFQRADAWAAGFVLGVHDNIMLTRTANLTSQYIITNYSKAQGGPTGADAKAIEAK